MSFTPGEILQHTICLINVTFIGLVVASTIYFMSPIILYRWTHDKCGKPLPPGPPISYSFLCKYPELSVDNGAKKYGLAVEYDDDGGDDILTTRMD